MDRNTTTCSIKELGLKNFAKVDIDLFSCLQLHPIKKWSLAVCFLRIFSTHSEVVSAYWLS